MYIISTINVNTVYNFILYFINNKREEAFTFLL